MIKTNSNILLRQIAETAESCNELLVIDFSLEVVSVNQETIKSMDSRFPLKETDLLLWNYCVGFDAFLCNTMLLAHSKNNRDK